MKISSIFISDGEQIFSGDRCSKDFRQNDMANTNLEHIRVCW
jgi:hypothetical protein